MADMHPGIIEHTLFSGVVIHITPLSPMLQSAILQAAKAKFPDPSKAPYMKEVENSAIPGDKFFDDKDPAYLAELAEVNEARNREYSLQLREFALSFPDGQDAIMRRFDTELRKLRKLKPAFNDIDDWLLTLEYFVVTSDQEWNIIYAAAQGNAPLTEGEIHDAWRIFRVDLQAYTARKVVTAPPRPKREQSRTG